jgi:poly(A) polymerase
VDQARFRAAFDFMRLRADVGEVEEVLADWWQEFSMADDNLRQDLVDQVREEQQKRKHAPRVHRVLRADAPAVDRVTATPSESAALPADPTEGDNAAPRKRRRRRRPGSASGGGAAAEGGGSPAN